MNCLVLGCAGGIGSVLTEYLYKKGNKIIGVDNFSNGYRENVNEDYCEFHYLDIKDYDLICWVLNNYYIDTIIHLAAISSLPKCEQDPNECFYQNTLGTSKVLEAARRYNVKNVIFASSSSVYEKNTEDILTENLIVKPTLAYPLSKKLAEDICLSYIEKYGMNISILRLFNVFGPRQDIYRQSPPLINYIVKQIIKKEPVQLHSDGKQSRCYISVDNVCRAIEGCINQSASGIYNICSSRPVCVADIYSEICHVLSHDKQAIYNDSENFWKDYDIQIKKDLVVKEVNKSARGSNMKFYNELGINLNENSLDLIGQTAKEIYNTYDGKL